MYKSTKWLDRVIDAANGEIIQEGTDQSAAHFNNMENGISDAHMAFALLNAMYRNEFDLRKVVVFEGEAAANMGPGPLLPDGFTAENCFVVSVMASTDGTRFILDNAKEYLNVSVNKGQSADFISIVNQKTDTSVHYKVAVQRYK